MQNILIPPSMILTESPPWGFKMQAFKSPIIKAVLIKMGPISLIFLNGLNYQSICFKIYLNENDLFAIL